MVGDNAVDAGAVKAGCVTLVLPDSPPGDTTTLDEGWFWRFDAAQ